MDDANSEPGPLRGTTPGSKPPPESGGMRAYGWQWGADQDREPGLPWIGIFLVGLGGLLLLDRALPEYVSIRNVLVLAAGLAFLVIWGLRRSTFALYAGALLTANAIPGLVEGFGVFVGPGFGALCYGLAFLFIAAVRMSRGGGLGWQVLVGGLLVLYGGSQLAMPDLAEWVLPVLLVALGVILLTRGREVAR